MRSGKFEVLGTGIDATDYGSAVDAIISAARERRPFAVSAIAVHGVMTGVLDPEHRYRLNHLDLVVPDGQPVKWALNLLHRCNLTDRVYGPTLTLKVCEAAARERLPVFLYGSRCETLTDLAQNLTGKFPGLEICGQEPSAFRCLTGAEQKAMADRIVASGARIVLVGLGCPRQEVWVYEHRALLPMPALAVGAAFDFHAGHLSQAPRLMQDHGLEWLYRLTREPGRLWRRYLYLNPIYLGLLALQFAGLAAFRSPRPAKAIRYG